MEQQFEWVPFIKELAEKIGEYRNRQPELIEKLKTIIEKHQINLGAKYFDFFVKIQKIDPFTAITNTLYSTDQANKKPILEDLQRLFEISSNIPENLDGFVSTGATYQTTGSKNPEQEIELLWDFYDEIKINQIKAETFNSVLTNVKGVQITSITTSISWVKPDKYLRLNYITDGYINKTYGINYKKIKNYQQYQDVLNIIQLNDNNMAEVYYRAYQYYNKEGIKEMSHSFNFIEIINKLKEELDNSTDAKGKFTVCKPKKTYVWIKDYTNLIGTSVCHYEIIYRDNKINVDVHFESNNPEINTHFKELLNNLPEELKEIEWRKSINGIRFGDGINPNVDDDEIIKEIIRQIMFIDKHLGDRLRYILKNYQNETEITLEHSYPLNTILYGPPGTGKTYNVINKALHIIDPTFFREYADNRTLLKERFDKLQNDGKIALVTFHQSYGYEEFVEGIKPTVDETSNGVTYEVKSGIFASICEKARKNYYQSIKATTYKDFDKVWKELFKQIDFSNNEKLTVNMKKSEYYITDYNNKTIRFEKKEGSSVHTLSIDSLKKMYESGDNYFVGGLRPYYDALLNKLNTTNVSINEEPLQNYVLIIDEINRGNISKIFGELITLIEDSKRLGNSEALTVKLPYSNEDFGVPSNLYIVGTMNTADRSIALMDTALRRRFIFEEMMPQPDLLVDKDNEELVIEGINLCLMLTKINERIEFLYDRDHTIGHAYFIGLKDVDPDLQYAELCLIFRNRIIPLLQEYFYDDWEKIQMVLGDHKKQKNVTDDLRFIKSKDFSEKAVLGFDHEDLSDKTSYLINKKLDDCSIAPAAFIKIYQEHSNSRQEA